MGKQPAMQFYIGDWMKDPALRVCSLAARGLWMDMLCLMHESPRRGHLVNQRGEPLSTAQLARFVGSTPRTVRALQDELLCNGVYSTDDMKVIFSRRMKREAEMREDDVKRQQKHRGLLNQKEIDENRHGVVTDSVTDSSQRAASASALASASSTSKPKTSTNTLSSTSSTESPPGATTTERQRDVLDLDLDAADDGEQTPPVDFDVRRLTPAEQQQREAEATERRRTDKRDNDVVRSMFDFYCATLHRDTARYTFTEARRKKGLSRLRERVKATGSLAGAIVDFQTAISNLAASEYHVTNGYIDWNDQIVRSAEDFEKRLNWQKPTATATNGGGGNGQHSEHRERFESVDEHNKRVAREAIERNNEQDRRAVAAARGHATNKSA